MAEGLAPASGQDCPRDPSFYEGKYTLAEDAEFSGGFAFLRSIKLIAKPLLKRGMRKGETFTLQSVQEFTAQLESALRSASDSRVHLGIVATYIDRCTPEDASTGELHLIVQVFDSNPSLALFRKFESRKAESEDPATAAQSANPRSEVKFQPRAEYNSSDKLFAGGTFRASLPRGPIRSLTLDGTGSGQGGKGNFALTGDHTWDSGFLQSASWHFGFHYSDRPASEKNLRESSIYGQVQLASQPLGPLETILRFASEIGGGNSQSGLEQRTLPAGTLASAADQTWKNAVGVTTRVGHNSIAASYGFQLGRTGGDRLVDYYKHFADIAYSTYKLVGDHKLLEYETRFTAGKLGIRGYVPAGERFFGGNRETDLFSGSEVSSDWHVRTNPFLRGIPANQLNQTAVGGPITGGEAFVAWNNTIGLPFPFFNYPLLPNRVTDSDDFKRGLKKERSVNNSALKVSYTADDSEYKKAVQKIPDVTATLKQALAITDEIKNSTGDGKAEAAACSSVIKTRQGTLDEAAEAMQIVVDETDSDAVIPPVRQCLQKVQTRRPDPRFDALLLDLEHQSTAITGLLGKVDTEKVNKQVARDMALVDRVTQVFFKEASLVSVRPIVVFDIARMTGPSAGTAPFGVRYSIGGGVRLQFLRVVNLSVGYAANPRKQSLESPGALFFSLDFLDLFR